jgi:hypothetical protein
LHDASLDPYFNEWPVARRLLQKARENASTVALVFAVGAVLGTRIFLN